MLSCYLPKTTNIKAHHHFSSLLLFNSGEFLWIVASVSCTSLQTWHSVCSSAAVACCFTVHDVVIQRCSSAYFVTSGFFKSLLPLTGYFLFFRSYSANSRNVFVENPSRSNSKSRQVQVQIPLLWTGQCKQSQWNSETVTMISEIKSFKYCTV